MAITSLRVKVGDHWYTVEIGDLTQSPVEVNVDGETFLVELDQLPQQSPTRPRRGRTQSQSAASLPPTPSPSASQPQSNSTIRSPMPGRVMSITVRPGDRVEAGQEVCVVEAMKMEQSIRAPRSGVVREIHVQPLDSVSANDPLIDLE